MKAKPLPRCKLWIARGSIHSVFGDGKFALLASIKKTGSIKKAALSLSVSYRKAWGDIRKAEEGTGMRLVMKVRGGADGGRTVLTEAGEKIIAAYSRFKKDINLKVESSFRIFFKEIL